MIGSFALDQEAKALIAELAELTLSLLPEQLGIDEFIPGCRVTDLGAGAYPRTITVALRNQCFLFARLRADMGLAVDDFVTVIHVRDGNFYEVYGRSGSSGGAGLTVHTHADNTQGGLLDWDDIWSDAVHDHGADAEGSQNLGAFRAAVAAGAVTIVAVGNVTAILTATYAVDESGGGTSGGTATLTLAGSVNIYNDGVDILTLAVGAGGDVTLQRTAGAATFDVRVLTVWV